LNLLLAGAGGSVAYFVNLVGKGAPLWQQAGIGAASAYLFVVAAIVLWRCLRIGPLWPPSNEPANFPMQGFSIDSIRAVELRNKQACIAANMQRNDFVGAWLNRCRKLAVATPIVFAAAAALVAY
jgi:hypothetical protein